MTQSQKNFVKKRRVPRRRYSEKVGVLFHGAYEICQAYEIGERGMLIGCSFLPRENEKVLITFHVPGLLHSVVRATVRYSLGDVGPSGLRYGCEFDDLAFTARRMIRIFVASKQTIEDETTFSRVPVPPTSSASPSKPKPNHY